VTWRPFCSRPSHREVKIDDVWKYLQTIVIGLYAVCEQKLANPDRVLSQLGTAFTNRCRAVRKMNVERQKTHLVTRDRSIKSEKLEFECQLKPPTRSQLQELLNLGTFSPHILFQSLIATQDLLRLREDMWPNHRPTRKGWWC